MPQIGFFSFRAGRFCVLCGQRGIRTIAPTSYLHTCANKKQKQKKWMSIDVRTIYRIVQSIEMTCLTLGKSGSGARQWA